jgi:hypothetical protein
VWHRFAYTSHPILKEEVDRMIAERLELYKLSSPVLEENLKRSYGLDANHSSSIRRLNERRGRRREKQGFRFRHEDDAYNTIMQWLYHKIADTR